jgi:hypothetical protein
MTDHLERTTYNDMVGAGEWVVRTDLLALPAVLQQYSNSTPAVLQHGLPTDLVCSRCMSLRANHQQPSTPS